MLKASPTSTPLAQQRSASGPFRIARSAASQARIISRISSASTLFVREIATNDGNTASASAPATPAQRAEAPREHEVEQRDREHAEIASGSSRLSGVKPNSLALSACTHRPSGGLSTMISPPGSKETKKKLCHERSIDFTPAE